MEKMRGVFLGRTLEGVWVANLRILNAIEGWRRRLACSLSLVGGRRENIPDRAAVPAVRWVELGRPVHSKAGCQKLLEPVTWRNLDPLD